ncbi:MAG: type II toxin-antitoxin system HicB family antitoxin [Pirellulales bacterium]|nr:type II toxin-antitoxin system HicB family antitoxin [Pirellulales bacterium]
MNHYTSIIQKDGDWWVGWVEEIPGVNCQERSRAKLLESIQEALSEMLQLNREAAASASAATDTSERVKVTA